MITSGDDLLEPIIAFYKGDSFDPSADSPLTALLTRDLEVRAQTLAIVYKNSIDALSNERQSYHNNNQLKWQALIDGGDTIRTATDPVLEVSDVRVAPLVQSKWYQDTSTVFGDDIVYNYYTPNNYLCGCVATAMSQVMRYHRHPVSVSAENGPITITGTQSWSRKEPMLGGDLKGGPYDYDLMPLDPTTGPIRLGERQMLGRLCHDAGVGSAMYYSPSASGAFLTVAAEAMSDYFDYAQSFAVILNELNISPPTDIIKSNLDAGYPVIFGMYGPVGGHAIVGDGYGFHSNTEFHHLNLGWAGVDDLWYALPDASFVGLNTLSDIIFNLFPDKTGEIISGRVTDSGGNPLPSVTVTATDGTSTIETTTDSHGIYAFVGVASETTYTITAQTAAGYSRLTTTGRSATSNEVPRFGNIWGIDFTSDSTPDLATITIAEAPGGQTLPAPGRHTVEKGSTFKITAINYPNFTFSQWEITNEISVDSASSAIGLFSATGDSTITPSFAAGASSLVDFSIRATPSEGGTTLPSPNVYTRIHGEEIAISAFAAPGYTFSGWYPEEHAQNSAHLQSTVYLWKTDSISVKALFAKDMTIAKADLSLNNASDYRDRIVVRGTHSVAEFNPNSDRISIILGDAEFITKPVSYSNQKLWTLKKNNTVLVYRSPETDLERFTFTLDMTKGTWSFKALAANLKNHVKNSLFVGLARAGGRIDSAMLSANDISSRSTWSFLSRRKRHTQEELPIKANLETLPLEIKKAAGEFRTERRVRNRFTISDAKLTIDGTEDVQLSIGELNVTIPAAQLTRKNDRLIYRSPRGQLPKVRATFDLRRDTWNLDIRYFDNSFLDWLYGKVHIQLQVGNKATEVFLTGKQRTRIVK